VIRRGLRALGLVMLAACGHADEVPAAPTPQTIHVAVIGGMMETGFWQELTKNYEQLTGHKIEVVATGPKPQVIAAYRKGGIDLITVHASDAMVNLVADGLAVDPQPWLRNDLVIMGPTADPAGIRGEQDAVVAIRKIIAAKAPLLVHASMGADGVLHDLREAGNLVLDDKVTIFFNEENQHAVLQRAAEAKAYTMVGRIPVLIGKLHAEGMEIMVKGDPRLRRPHLVEYAPNANAATRDFAAWLRSPETQQWIAKFGVGKYDDQPVFYPAK
jgi:tungstate transport system substrate-binding protein